MAGDRGDDLARAQLAEQNSAQRSGAQHASIGAIRQAATSGPRSRTREGSKARDPGARDRAAVVNSAGAAGLAWLFRIAMKAKP